METTNFTGSQRAYFLRAGEGETSSLPGQTAMSLLRPEDAGQPLELTVFTGSKPVESPLHSHNDAHEALYALDGKLELWLDGKICLLSRGDFASIPPGTIHGWRMQSHRTRFLCATAGELRAIPAAGAPPTDAMTPITRLPSKSIPYILEAGEGERMITGDQLFTLLTHQGSTNGALLCITTQGPKGERIPKHFHEKHTETFYCLEGILTMWMGDREVTLHAGDFLHAPPGTIHSYRLDAPYTNFLGVLAPGLFEPFFRTPCDDYNFPAAPRPVRIDRVIAKLSELDLKFVEGGRPPNGH